MNEKDSKEQKDSNFLYFSEKKSYENKKHVPTETFFTKSPTNSEIMYYF